MFLLVLIVVLYAAVWWYFRKKFPEPPLPSAVLISGAGTGFGRLTSLRLAKLGYTVYSGVLSPEEGDRLQEDFEKEVSSDSGKENDGRKRQYHSRRIRHHRQEECVGGLQNAQQRPLWDGPSSSRQ